MSRLLFFVYAGIIAFGGPCLGQEYSVSGNLKDNSGLVLPQAIVTLLQAADSSSAGFEITDDLGSFTFNGVKAGEYILVVQSIGYVQLTHRLMVGGNMSSISLVLSKAPTQLGEVTVTDKRPFIESGLGKTIINVAASTVSAGSNVLELLRKAPGVEVQGSSISLQGAVVHVLIDDKQTWLSGEELADYLRSLSAEQVAQIELITQPSSRYDAEGVGGIINIKTAKLRKSGIDGNLSIAAAQNVYPNTHDNLNLSYRGEKLALYANAGYLHATASLERTADQVVSDPATGALLNQSFLSSRQKETFEDYSVRLGADFTFTPKATIGASLKGIYHPNNEHDETYTDLIDNSGRITRNITFSDLGHLRHLYICNGYLKYTPTKDQSLTIDADYLLRDQHNYLDLYSYNYDAVQQPAGRDLFLTSNGRSYIQAAVLKCDFEATLPNHLKIEAGVKSSFSSTENGVYFDVLSNGVWANDTSRTNTFIYRENINAAYVSATKSFGKKWKTQLGLRAENTNAQGRQVVHDQEFSRSGTSLFPTMFVSYTASEKHTLELNCGRRISRAAYTQLNPFIFFRSQYNYYQGNPNLMPSFEWFTSLRHNMVNKVFSEVRYRHTTGIVTPIVTFNNNTNAVVASLHNFASSHSASFSITGSRQIYKWWRCSPSLGVNHNAYYGLDRHKAVAAATGFYFSIENELSLRSGWSVDTSYYFGYGELQNLLDLYGPRHWMGFNVAKKIWRESATLRLSVDDPFDLNNVPSSIDYNGLVSSTTNKWNTQQVAIGFTYNFGKRDTAPQRQSNSEEAGRM